MQKSNKYKPGNFTIEDFEEVLRGLKIPENEFLRFFPTTQQEQDLLEKCLKDYLNQTAK